MDIRVKYMLSIRENIHRDSLYNIYIGIASSRDFSLPSHQIGGPKRVSNTDYKHLKSPWHGVIAYPLMCNIYLIVLNSFYGCNGMG
jgi:hypothetical protein